MSGKIHWEAQPAATSEMQSSGDAKIIFDMPAPKGDVWEGIYMDDLLITQRMNMPYTIHLDCSFTPPEANDMDADMRKQRRLNEPMRPSACSEPNTRASG